MNQWTVGYITAGPDDVLLQCSIASARRELPDAQIIVVGGDGNLDCDLHVPFDESEKSGWITKKKNLIAKHADHENLVMLHDYIAFEPGWLKGADDFGYDWMTCMHRIINTDDSRYRDWCVIYNDAWMEPRIDHQLPPNGMGDGRRMHYDTKGHERWQYYSGAYFCVKRDVLLENLFDETRLQAQGEDVQWSRLLYKRYGPEVFNMNVGSSVRLQKYKPMVPWERLPCI